MQEECTWIWQVNQHVQFVLLDLIQVKVLLDVCFAVLVDFQARDSLNVRSVLLGSLQQQLVPYLHKHVQAVLLASIVQ